MPLGATLQGYFLFKKNVVLQKWQKWGKSLVYILQKIAVI